jgi:hypothetical protein
MWKSKLISQAAPHHSEALRLSKPRAYERGTTACFKQGQIRFHSNPTDVRDPNPTQCILDDLADHVQLVVARYGLEVPAGSSVNGIPRRFFARLNHV